MHRKIKIVKLDYNYCNYLRQFDNKVPYNIGIKEIRPFIGILFYVNNCEFFAPLSSPKKKHKLLRNTLDLIKINNGEFGVVNFNNMLPVKRNNYIEYNLDLKTNTTDEKKWIILLNNQSRWLNDNKKEIYLKSKLLYNLYINNKLPVNVKNRCCNFQLLE